jgi:hypothetical protein
VQADTIKPSISSRADERLDLNIFVLDREIERCAQYHHDRHVVKMVLESAQMLCTVLNQHGLRAPYRSTHPHHPCTLWAGESLSNWRWLRQLALQLNQEYRFRFERERDHRSAIVVSELPEPPIPDLGLTEFAQAMPDPYKVPGDAVAAYRRFYLAEKAAAARWTRRPVPGWFANGLSSAIGSDGDRDSRRLG